MTEAGKMTDEVMREIICGLIYAHSPDDIRDVALSWFNDRINFTEAAILEGFDVFSLDRSDDVVIQ